MSFHSEDRTTELVDDAPVQERIGRLWSDVGIRFKILVGMIAVLILLFAFVAFKEVTKAPPLKPWQPIDTIQDPQRIGCLNVVVPGVCLPIEPVQVYPNGLGSDAVTTSYPTMHVPLDGPFPDFTIKTQQCTNEEISGVKGESWTILAVPEDGTVDRFSGITDKPVLKGCTPYSVVGHVGPEQQARVKELYGEGVHTTVWQVQGTVTPLNPPSGTYAVPVNFVTDNYAIVYGG